MTDSPTSRPIIVGIDGSTAAIRAALWATDEALCRDVPLRLHCAIEHGDTVAVKPDAAARTLATAETAVRRAVTAIEATGRPVKTETAIVHGPPTASLIDASASAAMLCVGSVGLRHFRPGRVGSTAAALAISARCPVAIIRSRTDHIEQSPRAIVVEVDRSRDNGVLLGAAVEEARLRNATVEAILCRKTASEDKAADCDGDRRALADLNRRLAGWKHRYPHLQVKSVTVQGTVLDYLASHRRSVQLVIAGAHNREHVGELVGPAGNAVLHDADCSVLIVNSQHL